MRKPILNNGNSINGWAKQDITNDFPPIPLDDGFFASPAALKAFQIVMDFDAGRLWAVPIRNTGKYGLSKHWKIHKNALDDGGIPEKIELYSYFRKEDLEAFLRFVRENFQFAAPDSKVPSVFKIALALDRTKTYTSKWKEYTWTGYGYKHELTETLVHRRGCYLIRVYRLVKPEENGYFKVEFSYLRSSRKGSVRSAYALNKLACIAELARKVENAFEPVGNPEDCTKETETVEQFEAKVAEALKNRVRKKKSDPNQQKLF